MSAWGECDDEAALEARDWTVRVEDETEHAGPVIVRRPHLVERAARWFATHFPGLTLYAVKANHQRWALEALGRGGVRGWEVASAAELDRLASVRPGEFTAFMHPVKAPAVIAHAYFRRGCRTFALDHPDEWTKILAATQGAGDLTAVVRLAVPNTGAAMPLTVKFGAHPEGAAALLRRIRPHVARIGIGFHVGSQNARPQAFAEAMRLADAVARRAGVALEVLDVGGGFPEAYPGLSAPPLSAYVTAIAEARAALSPWARGAQLWCEPGRALVAAGESLITNVLLRKGDALYLDDGGSGVLFDAVRAAWRFPARVLRQGAVTGAVTGAACVPFRLYGPTCDSDDVFAHETPLPADVAAGDQIEFGQVGAYGVVMASRFNGFGVYRHVVADDAPWPSTVPAPDAAAASEAVFA